MRPEAQKSLKRALFALSGLAVMLSAGAQPVPAPPSSPSSSPGGNAAEACILRPRVCMALRIANLAIIEAARANGEPNPGVCTLLPRSTACGGSSPQAYMNHGPTGRPDEIELGRWLLNWYLENLSCAQLCAGKPDPAACESKCWGGEDPRGPFPIPGPGRPPISKQ